LTESEDEKKEKPVAFDIASLETPLIISLFINILTAKAWQHMGIQVKPGTDKVEKNLDLAKLAISSIEALVEKLQPHVKDDEFKKIKYLLSDLQINFAKQA